MQNEELLNQIEALLDRKLQPVYELLKEKGKSSRIETESVTVAEAAALIGVSDGYIRKMISKKILPAFKEEGFITRILKSELKKL